MHRAIEDIIQVVGLDGDNSPGAVREEMNNYLRINYNRIKRAIENIFSNLLEPGEEVTKGNIEEYIDKSFLSSLDYRNEIGSKGLSKTCKNSIVKIIYQLKPWLEGTQEFSRRNREANEKFEAERSLVLKGKKWYQFWK